MDRQAFDQEVNQIIRSNFPLSMRKEKINSLIQKYMNRTGNRPDSWQLYRLANCLLREELKNKSPDKITNTEYPILSRYQIRTRERREKPMEATRLDILKRNR